MNLGKVAELLGLDFDSSPLLDPTQLLERLDRFLLAIDAVAPKVSSQVLDKKLPGRDRTVLQLLHHTADVAMSFTVDEEISQAEHISEDYALDTSSSLSSLSRKIQFTRTIVQEINIDWQSTANTPYGLQTKHQVLERCTWHVAQHIRQLEHFIERWQQTVRGWPSTVDYDGLPLPESIWDD